MVTTKHKSGWRVWALSLGKKTGRDDIEADRVAIVRTVIFSTYLITNIFIVAGVIRHWNDENYDQPTRDELRTKGLGRFVHREEATLGDVCLLLSEGRSGALTTPLWEESSEVANPPTGHQPLPRGFFS